MSKTRRWLKRTIVGGLALGVGLYVAACTLMYVFQDQLLYIPAAEITTTPADVGLAFEPVTFESADGESIAAWFVPAAASRGVVLYSHGNAGNMSNRVPVVEDLHALGLDVLIFDYHGFGGSTGEPGETETYRDAEAAWAWLARERAVPPDRIIVWGRSLGGGVATWLATRTHPAALVVESSFTSIPDVAAVHYPYLPVHMLTRHEYPSLTRMPEISAPLLVAHGQADRVVPYAHGRALFEAASEPKTFVELGGGHNDPGLASPQYRSQLERFLDEVLGPTPG